MERPGLPEWIETERLRIRAPREDDAEVVRAAIEETFETLRRWMPWAQRVPTLDEERARLAESRRAIEAREDFPLFAFERASGALVVASGLHRPNWDVPSFETGYWVRAGYTGRGYVTEACRAITAAAFGALGAARVEIRCHAENAGSRRVAERCGFTLEGVLRNERNATSTESSETPASTLVSGPPRGARGARSVDRRRSPEDRKRVRRGARRPRSGHLKAVRAYARVR